MYCLRVSISFSLVIIYVSINVPPPHLARAVVLGLPALRQVRVCPREQVNELHEVSVVLVPHEGSGVATHPGHHVAHAGATLVQLARGLEGEEGGCKG